MRTDLSILEELGAELAPADDQPPADVRHRFLNGMRQPARPGRRTPGLKGVRLAWQLGVPAVAAAAVGVALVVPQLPGTSGRPAPPDVVVGARPGDSQPSAGPVETRPPDAVQVLRLAAQHSATQPTLVARPDQFLYIDSMEVQSTTDLTKDGDGEIVAGETTVSEPLQTRTWLSVDGTRDGLVLQGATRTRLDGCTDGRQAETIDRPETSPEVDCVPEPAYRPGRVPADPALLLAYVYEQAADNPTGVAVPKGTIQLTADQVAFSQIAEILYKNHLPAVQEAAFRVAGQIPGVRVNYDVTDAAGRPGVAVTRSEAGTREELVFDPVTYRYLGHNIIGDELTGDEVVSPPRGAKGRVRIGSGPEPGEVVYKSALLGVAVVDRAGRRS